jgi:hypothetical protein
MELQAEMKRERDLQRGNGKNAAQTPAGGRLQIGTAGRK